ncbi:MAG: beta-lactamase family protein [Desulfamplus sp.]|nr:beta-lactamase family protein [Desulfamplus sp.]
MRKNYFQNNKMRLSLLSKGHFVRSAFVSLIMVSLLISIGCNSDSEDFVSTHTGKFLDAHVRGLDYVSGVASGVTDESGIFTFQRNQNITFKLGNIQIGETVPVVSGLEVGEFLPEVWLFTPRNLVPNATNNRDLVVTNIIRFLQTLDDDYDFYDGVDNAANGIYISDAVRANAAKLNLSLDFTLSEAEFTKAAETVISSLTGEYRRLILPVSAQNHFISQLILNKIDHALNDYKTPGVTLSIESPCPCTPTDTECIESGEIDGIVRYDSKSHAYIWDFAAGYADLENKRPMTVNTRFRICSLTKSFVAMTILKLVEAGLLDYNDLLKNHLPEPIKATFNTAFDLPSPMGGDYPTYADATTIAKVMNHSAGIPNFYHIPSTFFLDLLFRPEKQYDVYELVQDSLQDGPLFYPSMGWAYSNTGYALLGLMIEEVTGKPWEDVIRERIIKPFGLTNTLIPETGETSIMGPYASDTSGTTDYAYGYLSVYGLTGGIYGKDYDPLMKRDEQDPSFLNSAGNIIGTAPDLRKWAKLIANSGTKDGLFGENFDWLHDSNHYDNIFFQLSPYLKVGANVYHNLYKQQYVISGNSTGYDVNATYDIENRVAVGACANRTYDETSVPSHSGPDIWKFSDSHTIQIKDVIVFDVVDILTR